MKAASRDVVGGTLYNEFYWLDYMQQLGRGHTEPNIRILQQVSYPNIAQMGDDESWLNTRKTLHTHIQNFKFNTGLSQ